MRKSIWKTMATAMVMSVLFAGAALADGDNVTEVVSAPETAVETEAAAEADTAATGWEQVGGKWFYWQADGTCAKNTWIVDENTMERYWMREDGVMATSQWVSDGGNWYYVGQNGCILRNQFLTTNNGNTNYWLGEDGVMAANEWVAVTKENGGTDWYYFRADGSTMSKGWHNIDGDDYYFFKGGKIAIDAVVSGGRVDADGKRVK